MSLLPTGARVTLASCCAMGLFTVACATPADDAVKGATAPLAQQREAAQKRLNQEEQACAGQFLHNECVQRARERHWPALDALRRQEVEQNESRRKAQAEARQRALSARTAPGAKSTGAQARQTNDLAARSEQANQRAQASRMRQQAKTQAQDQHAAKQKAAPAREQEFLEKQRQADDRRRAKAANPQAEKKVQPLPVPP